MGEGVGWGGGRGREGVGRVGGGGGVIDLRTEMHERPTEIFHLYYTVTVTLLDNFTFIVQTQLLYLIT